MSHDSTDTESLLSTVYQAIHALARRRMAREGRGHTLQPTALVNEVYLRLAKGDRQWSGPAHFYGAAAEAMRRILIDHARKRSAGKRGGNEAPASVDEGQLPFEFQHGLTPSELIDLHESLDALEEEAPKHALVVKLKFFVGMTADEVAESLELSVPTVNRYWALAKTWLHERMAEPHERR